MGPQEPDTSTGFSLKDWIQKLGPFLEMWGPPGGYVRSGSAGTDLARGFSSGRPLLSFWLGLRAGSVLCRCNFFADFFTCSNQRKGGAGAAVGVGLPQTPELFL